MRREELADLNAFAMIAAERSFTRAAAKLGTSQSALSYSLKRLEERLGVQLLTRTTRSTVPTEAGERLLRTLTPAFDQIAAELASLTALRDTPAGTFRITTSDHAAETLLWPKLAETLRDYPDITVELVVDNGLTDIVTERFDAGVRLGEHVTKDMVALPIGPDIRAAIVGSPAYFARHGVPLHPRDLVQHRCINIRFPTRGGLYAWEFEKDGQELRVRVQGQLVFNRITPILHAAEDGLGLAYALEDHALPLIAAGKLVRVLEDWCAPFAGYHLYYPSLRQITPAFAVLLDALRYRP